MDPGRRLQIENAQFDYLVMGFESFELESDWLWAVSGLVQAMEMTLTHCSTLILFEKVAPPRSVLVWLSTCF
jgi:hypothetical protein